MEVHAQAREERADRIRQVADQLTLPLAALAGDDLLVSGVSALDADTAGLDRILLKWNAGTDYFVRITDLTTTDLIPGTSVVDDTDTDVLAGGAGRDWSLAGVFDHVTLALDETRTTI